MPPGQGLHDVGGLEDWGSIDFTDRPYAYWERQTHAVVWLLTKKGHLTLDELRRSIEGLPDYAKRSYYDKWAAGAVGICLERGLFTRQQLDAALGGRKDGSNPPDIRFQPGDVVRVKEEGRGPLWRRTHIRTPGYIFGVVGVVERECVGLFKDPEVQAFREDGPPAPLYRVRFSQLDVWDLYKGPPGDALDVEIYQHWLEPSTQQQLEQQQQQRAVTRAQLQASCAAAAVAVGGGGGSGSGSTPSGSTQGHLGHQHHHDHTHDHTPGTGPAHHHHHHHDDHHDHDHVHEARDEVESAAVELEGDDAAGQQLPRALLQLLLEGGVISRSEVRAEMEAMDERGRRFDGARLVVRAWTDPAFKARLLEDTCAAAAEMGISTSNLGPPVSPPGTTPASASAAPAAAPSDAVATAAASSGSADASTAAAAAQASGGVAGPAVRHGTVLTAVADTPEVHNLVVCTLCSCYPISVLGMSPPWYRSRAYRARAVRDPRGLLAEFGTQLPPGVAVHVHDSTADCRYLVIPARPNGTEGWTEAQLLRCVTRDSMIGVALPRSADEAQERAVPA